MSRWIDDSLIHSRASAESVAMLRIWVFGLCAWRATTPISALGLMPSGTFSSYGFFERMPSPMLSLLLSPAGLAALQAATITFCVMAAIGILTRFSAVGATLVLILFEGTIRGFMGFVNHAQIPLILACLVLAVSPLDHALVIWPRRVQREAPAGYQFSLVAILSLLCLGYLFIGAHRLAYGGLELFRSESLRQWILYWNLTQPEPLATPGGWLISHPGLAGLAEAFFPLITLLEISAPLCVLSSRYRMFFVPAMLSVHLNILILMRINFVELALLYVVFIDSKYWSPTFLAAKQHGVVFFDGVCGLCNRFVDFLLPRDRADRLRYAPLQGSTAAAKLGPSAADDLSTIVLLEGDSARYRSDAVLAAIGRLGGPWAFVTVLGLVPRPMRDWVYDWVARNRYGWFGVLPACRIPAPADRLRVLP